MSAIDAIIVGFTPFHLIPMRELVSAVKGDVHVFHPMMAAMAGAFPRGLPISFLGNCDSQTRSRWRKYFSARREIDRMMRSGRHVDLYLPHPFNPLANYAFFHTGNCDRFIYQDGILNYYDARTPLSNVANRMRQRGKGLAVGARYQMYEGHLSGIDAAPVVGGFFTHPDRIVGRAKFSAIRRLEFRRGVDAEQAGARHDTLFLDQPVELVVGPDRAPELRRRTVEYVNSLGGRVLYKPHYAQGRTLSRDPGWIPLAPDLISLPAEWAVARLNVANVVSFCTSALVNIAMTHNAIACYATAARLIPVSIDGRSTDLGEVLSGLGVKLINVADR